MSQDTRKETTVCGKPGTREDGTGAQFIRTVRRLTRRKYSAEEKIRIVLEGLRGDLAVADLCRREGLHVNVYYKWLKDFMEAGKSRLAGDLRRGGYRRGGGDVAPGE